ncbi:MAG: patatin-like phospholipase family protein [Chitinophagaceae bacterium]|nr:patatin-like phospholipase family protein [Chitinophagaceae bacterium]
MKWLSLVLFLLFSFQVSSQHVQSARPKIGLTLSGGGAKGLAHIGILKAIDSAGLKVDYITGTSMGAIIGSLYAVGYSGDSFLPLPAKSTGMFYFAMELMFAAFSWKKRKNHPNTLLNSPGSIVGFNCLPAYSKHRSCGSNFRNSIFLFIQ